jgi:hypothetical protein
MKPRRTRNQRDHNGEPELTQARVNKARLTMPQQSQMTPCSRFFFHTKSAFVLCKNCQFERVVWHEEGLTWRWSLAEHIRAQWRRGIELIQLCEKLDADNTYRQARKYTAPGSQEAAQVHHFRRQRSSEARIIADMQHIETRDVGLTLTVGTGMPKSCERAAAAFVIDSAELCSSRYRSICP